MTVWNYPNFNAYNVTCVVDTPICALCCVLVVSSIRSSAHIRSQPAHSSHSVQLVVRLTFLQKTPIELWREDNCSLQSCRNRSNSKHTSILKLIQQTFTDLHHILVRHRACEHNTSGISTLDSLSDVSNEWQNVPTWSNNVEMWWFHHLLILRCGDAVWFFYLQKVAYIFSKFICFSIERKATLISGHLYPTMLTPPNM